jgi:exoribonuclease R
MPGGETLPLLAEIGPKRLQLEIGRGGVSLPLRAQHVQRVAARRLGYEVVYEDPNPAENWNAQISLLTGHAAALRMLEARIGLLRTMADADEGDVRRFRLAAKGLGFGWPERQSYREFIRGLNLARPHIEALVWQARRLMRAAGYTAFAGELPPEPIHAALAFEYAHCTAPLRRLADRYVLDLLISLAAGEQPDEPQITTLRKLPGVMAGATRKERELERRVVSVAEAWVLRDSVGSTFDALVLSAAGGRVEFQIEDPPVRARMDAPDGHPAVQGGTNLRLRLAEADLDAGRLRFELDQ